MDARFPKRVAKVPSKVRIYLQHLVTDKLQVRKGCTRASARQLLTAHYGLLFGYERPARRLTEGEVTARWGMMQINGQSRQPCRPE